MLAGSPAPTYPCQVLRNDHWCREVLCQAVWGQVEGVNGVGDLEGAEEDVSTISYQPSRAWKSYMDLASTNLCSPVGQAGVQHELREHTFPY